MLLASSAAVVKFAVVVVNILPANDAEGS